MAKQLNVNLAFTADTSQAKKQLQDLQKSLTNLTNNSFGNKELGLTKEIQEATVATAQLKAQLQSATNTTTGKLDLGLFNDSLQKSGMSLEKYRDKLVQLGPEGQKAFIGLAQAITNAELPLRRSSQLLDQFWTALKNTARWQLSSSALHGFMGAIQGAYGYAQNLDKSLNSIRIVSGQSAEQMAELAEHANKAAQALSTSTLAYTDAALIYYQQGLDPEEVAARTETTLKMSNVTGESADAVSSYMTAIWNNFAEGSENLEYFADVITALGASTASSSEEIANGMQQFAAVANTVGLSYEYAASALATIVAQTRQSESTVGNGLRTIFARFDSVKLGETLDDGVGLTKYTEALQKAGVSVLDQNGELKEMDEILNAIGEKWERMNATQKTALAQTVGGVRQYTNLMALFDNWDDFQANLQTAYGSTGSLQEQADIYAESWEAARKRVQAAWQAIYQDLIDDNFFIGVLDGVEKALQGLDAFIDGIGGVQGVLTNLGFVITTLFGDKIAKTLENLAYNIKMISESGRKEVEKLREDAWKLAVSEKADSITAGREDDQVALTEATNFKVTAQLQKTLYENASKMSEEELRTNQILLDQNKTLQDKNIELAKSVELAKEEEANQSLILMKQKQWKDLDPDSKNEMKTNITNVAKSYGEQLAALKKNKASLEEIDKLNEKYINSLDEIAGDNDELAQSIYNYADAIAHTVETQANLITGQDALAKNQEAITHIFQNPQPIIESWSTSIVNASRNLMALGNVINGIRGLGDIFNNDNLSGWQKFAAIASSISMIALNFKGAFTAIKDVVTDLGNGVKAVATVFSANTMQVRANYIASQQLKIQLLEETIARTQNKLAALEEGKAIAIRNRIAAGEGPITAYVAVQKEIEKTQRDLNALSMAKETVAQEALNEAQKKGLVLKAASIMAYWEIIIVIGLIVAAIALWKKEEQEKIEQLKNQREAIDDAKKSAEELADAYDRVKDSLDNLSEKSADLKKFKKGTDDWRIAVRELNTEMLDLIEKYDLIEGKDYKFNDGVIELTDGGRQTMLDAAYKQSQIARTSRTSATLVENVPTTTKLSRDISTEIANELSKRSGLDLDNTKIAEEYRNAIKAIYSSEATRREFGKLDSNSSDAAIKKFLTDKEGGLGISSPELIEAFSDLIKTDSDLISSLQQLDKTVSGSTAAQEAAVKTDVYDKFGPDISGVEANYLTNYILDEYNRLYAESGAATDEDYNRYAEDHGLHKNEEDEWVDAEGIVHKLDDIIVKSYLIYSEALDTAFDEYKNNTTLLEQETKKYLLNEQNKVSLEEQLDGVRNNEGKLASTEEIDNYLSGKSVQELEIILSGDGLPEGVKSLSDLDKHLEKMTKEQHNIPVNINVENLNNFKGDSKKTAQEDLVNEVLDLAKFIQNNLDDIAGLSKHLADCDAEAQKVAYSFIRFDDAMQDVANHYDDWKAALNSKDIVAINKAVEELEKTYGNLLDIDGSQLSDDFLKSATNAEYLNQILYGTEEEATAAYDKLEALAQEDILVNLGVNENSVDETLNYINQLKDEAGYDDIQVGASLDDTNLIAGLESMINALAHSATEAEELLQGFGFNADVEEQEVSEPEAREIIDLMPKVVPDADHIKIPKVADDGSIDYNEMDVPGLTYHPEEHSAEGESKKTFTALKIQSLHKSSGGAVKIHNSPARQAARDKKASNSGKGGSKSPKSSSPKKKTVKDHKEQKKEEDRYHDLKERIDDVNTALNRMGKTKDRVYGKAKLKYMDQELARMKDQIALTKEYIKEAEKYLKVDRAALEGIKKGAAFDQNGMLTNYEEVLKNITDAYNNQLAQYNAAVDKFNASEQEEGDNAALEAEEKALAKAEKTFNENKRILKQYEDTYNLIQKQQEELIDQLNEYYDTLLENVDIKVKMKIDLEEDDKKLLEWMYKYIGDSADYAADKIANLSKQMKASKNELDIMRKGITEIFKNHDMDVDVNNLDADDLVAQLRAYMNQEGLASEMTEAEVEKLREYRDALMEYYDQMYDNMVKGNEVLREMMEEQDDRIQRQLDNYDRLADAIEHWKDIAELTGEDVLGLNSQELNRLDQSRIMNDWNRMDSTKRYMEEREREYIKLQQSYAEAEAMGDELVLAEVRKNLELAEDLYHDAQDAWRDSWKKAQEDVNQAAENAMDRMVKDYKKALGDLDVLMERYDRQRENNHLYLEDYEKYHELNKSLKDLQNSMNNTNNQKMLSKMRDLEDEINANMQSGVKISERQAEVIARRVALLQAEAELMDAQNAKSAVRMTRDNEGNFSYTYTADQEQIDDAEQNYGDKFYELMKYEKDEIEALEAERLQSEAQYIEDLRNLWDEYRNGDISSYEEYLALVDELTAQYEERRQYYSDQEAFLFDEQARLRDEDWKDFEEITGNKLAEQHNFVDEFEDTITGQLLPGYQTLDEAQAEWAQVMSDGYEIAKTTAAEWQAATQNTLKQAGTDADNFKIKMLTDLGEIDKQSEVTKDKIEDMISGPGGVAEEFDEGIAASDKFNQEFAAHNEAEREQIRQTVEALNEMIRKLAETTQEEKNLETQSYITKGAVDTMAEAAEDAQGAVEALTDAANGLADAANRAADAIRSIPSMPGGSDGGPGGPGLSGISINRTGGYQGRLNNSDRRWLTDVSSAATGMYTGAWGNEGKLAILHEKELVLNRADTENMLDIVGTVRRIVASIGSGDFLNNLANSINNHVSNINKPNGILDQNVHIEASFPNVQSHSEIELALNNLINSASQYVNRK